MTDRTLSSLPSRLATFDRAFRLEEYEVHSKLAQLIASSQGVSRADLARLTGFARSTISQLAQPLIDAGLVKEQAAGAASRGRPGTMLVLNPRAGLVLVADMGATHGRLVISDLAQRRLAETVFSVDIALGPEPVLDLVIERFRQMLAEHHLADLAIRSVVVGLPSPVDFGRGVCVRPPIMPGWDEFPVSEYLQARLKAAVLVDNDVNLMALGEARTRPAGQSPLLFAKVSTGIGCGVVTADGSLHRGADGSAGDIGHIRVPGRDDVICGCGNIGCVEAVASTTAVLRSLRQLPDAGADTIDDLVRLVRAGDRHAIRLVREAAAEIGEVIAMVVHMFNPAAIVLGGRMARISDDLLAGVRAVVYRRALPLATRSLLIENTALNQYAGAIGGTVLGIEHALAPQCIASILDGITNR
ncbi:MULTISPECIES: ROK family transcriptional regulator [Paraburkholderia]|jgi:predicted NBD/HSP70 family sugar kinase|uniref:Sugar kinase of the NBD/HSP70 family, may contain an N-terminal HTH domain n=1 Tax=Paraburkholderia phenazinium TaxID=60549 RepID=A0A1N6GNU8_9BURK|nr:ROK family transcriptional regulator [Paraburkholderia phenazinium]SIO09184.1 Sugar kinase of the NBD/HSP70 family, may contain an N-terminal HTH domain [Paraburkholderia phenazinium]